MAEFVQHQISREWAIDRDATLSLQVPLSPVPFGVRNQQEKFVRRYGRSFPNSSVVEIADVALDAIESVRQAEGGMNVNARERIEDTAGVACDKNRAHIERLLMFNYTEPSKTDTASPALRHR